MGCHPTGFKCYPLCEGGACSASNPHCDANIGLCVECLSTTHCSDSNVCKSGKCD